MSWKCARVTFYAKCLLRISFPYATIHVETFAHQSKFRKTGLQFMKQLNSTNLVSVSAHTQWFPVAVSSFDWFDEQIYAIPGFGSCLNFLSDTISYRKVRPAHNQGPSAIIHVKHWRPSRVCRKSCNCGRKQSFEHPFRCRYKKARRTLSGGNLPTPN